MTEVLSRRARNRALLARQHLLSRVARPAETMIEHLVGMQAQNPLDPYVALWSRLEGFVPTDLATLIESRRAVRTGLLRMTLHLATADDALSLWPLIRPVRERAWLASPFRKQLPGFDVAPVVAVGRELVEAQPRTAADLGRRLHDLWPDQDASALSYVPRFLLPLVQVPPRGIWGRTGRPTWTTTEAWLGRPIESGASADATVLRYLGAFGPATVADIRIWSWLTGLRQVVERLRPELRTFRDESGRELFDLPDAPHPDPSTPAPPRFLPEYDNLLLSHQDRSHVIGSSAFGRLTGWVGTFLVDGFVRGQWRIDRGRDAAVLVLEPFEPIADEDGAALFEEGLRLLAFDSPAATERRVEFGIARERSAVPRPSIGGSGPGPDGPSGD